MKKRMIAILLAFVFLYSSITVRLYTLSVKKIEIADNSQKRYTLMIGEIRGEILDCNGEKLVSSEYDNVVALKPTVKALATLENVLDEKSYNMLKQRMKNSKALTVNIGDFEVDENQDVVMLKKYFRYSDTQIADHIIGYLNGEGKGVYGIEKSFDDILYTGKSLSVSFSSDVFGRVLSGTQITVNNGDIGKGSVMLTLDSRIQKIAEDALDSNGVECGGAIVVETQTGAIRAMVSRPDFDAGNIAAFLNDEKSPLLNRTLNAYSVGSVFKVAVAATAIENGKGDFTYDCKGSCNVDGTVFCCNNNTVHGKLDLTKALECSCNTFFIELASQLGAEKILETASLMGFGQGNVLTDAIVSKQGVVPSVSELESSGAFANFSFGQGRFTATMIQLNNMMSAVAGEGKYYKPYLIEKATNANGENIFTHRGGYPVYVLTEKTCEYLTDMLKSVVEKGNAQMAKPDNNVFAAGKTATAQTGIFDENGTEICNTWFAGFFDSGKTRYTVVILKERGVSGATDCAPVFKCIADEIVKLEKIS